MAATALIDAQVFGAGFDFTGVVNEGAVEANVDTKDASTFGSAGWTEVAGGMRSGVFSTKGFYEAGTGKVDPAAWAALGTADQVFILATSAAEGSPAFMFQGVESHYSVHGPIGELDPFELSAVSSGAGVVRGGLTKAKGTVSATGATGTPVLLPAASATQYVYAAVQAFSAGTTITVRVESDTAANFPSATTVATLPAITAVGGYWMVRVAGPQTDTYYRINVTAITGSFVIAAAIGIG